MPDSRLPLGQWETSLQSNAVIQAEVFNLAHSYLVRKSLVLNPQTAKNMHSGLASLSWFMSIQKPTGMCWFGISYHFNWTQNYPRSAGKIENPFINVLNWHTWHFNWPRNEPETIKWVCITAPFCDVRNPSKMVTCDKTRKFYSLLAT